MLRPIDVIFKHPVKKFTVIYQNGKLWQLPRLDFDGNSLRHKRPYTGSREQIFVAQDQRLPADDLLLRSQLATLDLPATVAGKNADEFERWWQQNSFELREASERAKQQQAHAKALLANPNAQPPQTPQTSITPKLETKLETKLENSVPPQTVELPTVSTQPQQAQVQPQVAPQSQQPQIQPASPQIQAPPMQTAIPLPTVSTQPMPEDFVPPTPQPQTPPAQVPEPQPVTQSAQKPPVKHVGLPPVPTTTTTDLSDFDDIFGDMMNDLTKGL